MMKRHDFSWNRVKLAGDDDFHTLTEKIQKQQIDEPLGESVYVVRIAKSFLLEYPKQTLSPVIYIGRGMLRRRLSAHAKNWVGELSELLNGVPMEAFFCLPKSEDGRGLHKAYEAHLLHLFKATHGALPLHNSRVEPVDPSRQFEAELPAKVFSLGSGNGRKFHWVIRRR